MLINFLQDLIVVTLAAFVIKTNFLQDLIVVTLATCVNKTNAWKVITITLQQMLCMILL